ncbi:MAG: hypothetical protein E7425_04210 [Ruminococcaceae bacterium]|nr:hypothetical protein [Oscillospiraceae bacterium]
MKHRILAAIGAAIMFCMSIPVYAAAPNGEPQPTETVEEAMTPPPPTVYPAEVHTSEENGVARLEKVYYLTARDDPAAIPTEDFDREGRHYTLLDVLKTDLTETDTKDFTEVITLESATKDVGEIIKALEPELEVVTEDGYSGVLKPDYTTINVEAAGYRTNSWTVSAKRTYPNLSDADVSLIPKSIEDGGRSLTLANVDWQAGNTDYVDGDALAVRYTALATYTGTATGRSVTGYTVTVDYTGEVSKSSSDTIIYTAVFSSTDKQTVEPVIPTSGDESGEAGNKSAEETVAPTPAPASAPSSKSRLLLIPVGVAALGAAGYFGRKGYKHYINKKRGYE